MQSSFHREGGNEFLSDPPPELSISLKHEIQSPLSLLWLASLEMLLVVMKLSSPVLHWRDRQETPHESPRKQGLSSAAGERLFSKCHSSTPKGRPKTVALVYATAGLQTISTHNARVTLNSLELQLPALCSNSAQSQLLTSQFLVLLEPFLSLFHMVLLEMSFLDQYHK